MKVKGRKEFLQSSIDFYIKIVSTNGIKSVDALRKYYFDRFLQEARNSMGTQVAEQKRNKAAEEPKEEEVVQNIGVVEESVIIEEEPKNTENEPEVSFTSKGFLDAIRNANRGNNSELKVVPLNISSADIVGKAHGTFIDELVARDLDAERHREEVNIARQKISDDRQRMLDRIRERKERREREKSEALAKTEEVRDVSVSESNIEFAEHGTFLEDVPELSSTFSVVESEVVSKTQEQYSPNGTFLEDLPDVEIISDEPEEYEFEEEEESYIEYEDDFEESQPVEDEETFEYEGEQSESRETQIGGYSFEEEDDVSQESAFDWDEILSEAEGEESSNSQSEELERVETPTTPVRTNPNVIDFPVNAVEQALEVSKADEPVSVPPTVRQFLKEHPGSAVEYVQQFYSKKAIEKELNQGKIYKRKGKLFI